MYGCFHTDEEYSDIWMALTSGEASDASIPSLRPLKVLFEILSFENIDKLLL